MSFFENSTGSDGFSPSRILDCSYSKIEIFSNTKNINQRYALLKKLIKNKDKQIIKKISKNIIEY